MPRLLPSWLRLRPAPVALALLLAFANALGCALLGPSGTGEGALARDAALLAPGDLAGPGSFVVDARKLTLTEKGRRTSVFVYRPRALGGLLPGVVFLPGLLAPAGQYQSIGRALASRGFVVAIRTRYGFFVSDRELAASASAIADWLVAEQGVDPRRLGIAGHSMGGKDAVLAALEDPRFRAVVAIDPDDRGDPSVVRGGLPRLAAPLLLIGAERGSEAASICADRDHDYRRFFARAPAGTVELTLLGADHVQVMDEPDRFELALCRSGTADSTAVRILTRRATVRFFLEHLTGATPGPLDLGTVGARQVRGAAPDPPAGS